MGKDDAALKRSHCSRETAHHDGLMGGIGGLSARRLRGSEG